MGVRDKTVEIVLPSGSFARIEHVTYRSFWQSMQGEPNLMVARFAALVVTIDGKPITVDQIMEMDVDDGAAVMALANTRLAKALSTMSGVS